jgi:hypothetical protein
MVNYVILSVVRRNEVESNGVEGSGEITIRGELPEILRLRRIPLRCVRLCSE